MTKQAHTQQEAVAADGSARALRLGHELWSLRPTLHNGPGWRVPLWVQGCSLRCTVVCLNPHFLDYDGGHVHDVDAVVARIADVVGRSGRDIEVEGITVLGGEPTDQAEAVGLLFRGVKAIGLSTMLYSGATIEALRSRCSGAVEALLDLTDVLVDGPFQAREFDKSLIWRGSRNQRILCLSRRYSADDIDRALREQGKCYSMLLLPDGRLSVGGLQTRKGAKTIENMMASGLNTTTS